MRASYRSPDANDVPHLVENDTLQEVVLFEDVDVDDIKRHGAFEADGGAVGPHASRTSKSKDTKFSVYLFHRGLDEELASRGRSVASARHVCDNLRPSVRSKVYTKDARAGRFEPTSDSSSDMYVGVATFRVYFS